MHLYSICCMIVPSLWFLHYWLLGIPLLFDIHVDKNYTWWLCPISDCSEFVDALRFQQNKNIAGRVDAAPSMWHGHSQLSGRDGYYSPKCAKRIVLFIWGTGRNDNQFDNLVVDAQSDVMSVLRINWGQRLKVDRERGRETESGRPDLMRSRFNVIATSFAWQFSWILSMPAGQCSSMGFARDSILNGQHRNRLTRAEAQ